MSGLRFEMSRHGAPDAGATANERSDPFSRSRMRSPSRATARRGPTPFSGPVTGHRFP
jgi:hypothetical protein